MAKINEHCQHLSAEQIREVTDPVLEVLSIRKEHHLNYLVETIQRVSAYRHDQQMVDQIQRLVGELEIDDSNSIIQTILPAAISQGRQNQAQRAESCTSIRLSDRYEFLNRTRSQGQMGWCFCLRCIRFNDFLLSTK